MRLQEGEGGRDGSRPHPPITVARFTAPRTLLLTAVFAMLLVSAPLVVVAGRKGASTSPIPPPPALQDTEPSTGTMPGNLTNQRDCWLAGGTHEFLMSASALSFYDAYEFCTTAHSAQLIGDITYLNDIYATPTATVGVPQFLAWVRFAIHGGTKEVFRYNGKQLTTREAEIIAATLPLLNRTFSITAPPRCYAVGLVARANLVTPCLSASTAHAVCVRPRFAPTRWITVHHASDATTPGSSSRPMQRGIAFGVVASPATRSNAEQYCRSIDAELAVIPGPIQPPAGQATIDIGGRVFGALYAALIETSGLYMSWLEDNATAPIAMERRAWPSCPSSLASPPSSPLGVWTGATVNSLGAVSFDEEVWYREYFGAMADLTDRSRFESLWVAPTLPGQPLAIKLVHSRTTYAAREANENTTLPFICSRVLQTLSFHAAPPPPPGSSLAERFPVLKTPLTAVAAHPNLLMTEYPFFEMGYSLRVTAPRTAPGSGRRPAPFLLLVNVSAAAFDDTQPHRNMTYGVIAETNTRAALIAVSNLSVARIRSVVTVLVPIHNMTRAEVDGATAADLVLVQQRSLVPIGPEPVLSNDNFTDQVVGSSPPVASLPTDIRGQVFGFSSGAAESSSGCYAAIPGAKAPWTRLSPATDARMLCQTAVLPIYPSSILDQLNLSSSSSLSPSPPPPDLYILRHMVVIEVIAHGEFNVTLTSATSEAVSALHSSIVMDELRRRDGLVVLPWRGDHLRHMLLERTFSRYGHPQSLNLNHRCNLSSPDIPHPYRMLQNPLLLLIDSYSGVFAPVFPNGRLRNTTTVGASPSTLVLGDAGVSRGFRHVPYGGMAFVSSMRNPSRLVINPTHMAVVFASPPRLRFWPGGSLPLALYAAFPVTPADDNATTIRIVADVRDNAPFPSRCFGLADDVLLLPRAGMSSGNRNNASWLGLGLRAFNTAFGGIYLYRDTIFPSTNGPLTSGGAAQWPTPAPCPSQFNLSFASTVPFLLDDPDLGSMDDGAEVDCFGQRSVDHRRMRPAQVGEAFAPSHRPSVIVERAEDVVDTSGPPPPLSEPFSGNRTDVFMTWDDIVWRNCHTTTIFEGHPAPPTAMSAKFINATTGLLQPLLWGANGTSSGGGALPRNVAFLVTSVSPHCVPFLSPHWRWAPFVGNLREVLVSNASVELPVREIQCQITVGLSALTAVAAGMYLHPPPPRDITLRQRSRLVVAAPSHILLSNVTPPEVIDLPVQITLTNALVDDRPYRRGGVNSTIMCPVHLYQPSLRVYVDATQLPQGGSVAMATVPTTAAGSWEFTGFLVTQRFNLTLNTTVAAMVHDVQRSLLVLRIGLFCESESLIIGVTSPLCSPFAIGPQQLQPNGGSRAAVGAPQQVTLPMGAPLRGETVPVTQLRQMSVNNWTTQYVLFVTPLMYNDTSLGGWDRTVIPIQLDTTARTAKNSLLHIAVPPSDSVVVNGSTVLQPFYVRMRLDEWTYRSLSQLYDSTPMMPAPGPRNFSLQSVVQVDVPSPCLDVPQVAIIDDKNDNPSTFFIAVNGSIPLANWTLGSRPLPVSVVAKGPPEYIDSDDIDDNPTQLSDAAFTSYYHVDIKLVLRSRRLDLCPSEARTIHLVMGIRMPSGATGPDVVVSLTVPVTLLPSPVGRVRLADLPPPPPPRSVSVPPPLFSSSAATLFPEIWDEGKASLRGVVDSGVVSDLGGTGIHVTATSTRDEAFSLCVWPTAAIGSANVTAAIGPLPSCLALNPGSPASFVWNATSSRRPRCFELVPRLVEQLRSIPGKVLSITRDFYCPQGVNVTVNVTATDISYLTSVNDTSSTQVNLSWTPSSSASPGDQSGGSLPEEGPLRVVPRAYLLLTTNATAFASGNGGMVQPTMVFTDAMGYAGQSLDVTIALAAHSCYTFAFRNADECPPWDVNVTLGLILPGLLPLGSGDLASVAAADSLPQLLWTDDYGNNRHVVRLSSTTHAPTAVESNAVKSFVIRKTVTLRFKASLSAPRMQVIARSVEARGLSVVSFLGTFPDDGGPPPYGETTYRGRLPSSWLQALDVNDVAGPPALQQKDSQSYVEVDHAATMIATISSWDEPRRVPFQGSMVPGKAIVQYNMSFWPIGGAVQRDLSSFQVHYYSSPSSLVTSIFTVWQGSLRYADAVGWTLPTDNNNSWMPCPWFDGPPGAAHPLPMRLLPSSDASVGSLIYGTMEAAASMVAPIAPPCLSHRRCRHARHQSRDLHGDDDPHGYRDDDRDRYWDDKYGHHHHGGHFDVVDDNDRRAQCHDLGDDDDGRQWVRDAAPTNDDERQPNGIDQRDAATADAGGPRRVGALGVPPRRGGSGSRDEHRDNGGGLLGSRYPFQQRCRRGHFSCRTSAAGVCQRFCSGGPLASSPHAAGRVRWSLPFPAR